MMRARLWLSAVILSLAAAAATPVLGSGKYWMAMNLHMWGPISEDTAHAPSNRKHKHLAYLARLGYTHFLYGLGDLNAYGDPKSFFRKTPDQGWIYNGGDYRGGGMATSFRAMKTAVEKQGMRLVPFMETLSHVHCLIALDSSIAEIGQWDSFCKERRLACGYGSHHVAALSDSTGAPGNPGAEQFFREYLRIMKANWGETRLGGKSPGALHMGHDELGGYSITETGAHLGPVGYVKEGRSRRSSMTGSELVAEEIAARTRTIGEFFGPDIDVMIFGDSFLPFDNGDHFGLVGSDSTGKDGTLWLLGNRHGLSGKLIVMPWGYSNLDGEFRPGPNVRSDKGAQLAFLERLGFRYIPGTGEDGGADAYQPAPLPTRKTLYQWFSAAMAHPSRLAGFAHLSFDDFDRCDAEDKVCVEYTAPLLAYLAWSLPDQGASFKGREYSDAIFSPVQEMRSVREKEWREGVHFTRPVVPKWWQFWR